MPNLISDTAVDRIAVAELDTPHAQSARRSTATPHDLIAHGE
jgi:hypothetical protein